MKKLIITGMICICATTMFAAFTKSNEKKVVKTEDCECKYARCAQIKKDGYQCKNCCAQYESYCSSHKAY